MGHLPGLENLGNEKIFLVRKVNVYAKRAFEILEILEIHVWEFHFQTLFYENHWTLFSLLRRINRSINSL